MMSRNTVKVPMINRQIVTGLRLRIWIFFIIAAEFDSFEIHLDMMDIKYKLLKRDRWTSRTLCAVMI